MKIYVKYIDDNGVHQNGDNLGINISTADNGFKATIKPETKIMLLDVWTTIEDAFEDEDRILVNGYQSWTDTREYKSSHDHINIKRKPWFTKLYHMDAYGDSPFYDYSNDILHGYTYAYVRKPAGDISLYGSFNEENAYLITEFDQKDHSLTLRSDVNGRVINAGEEFTVMNVGKFTGQVMDAQREYFSKIGKCEAPSMRGYCSWYNHYQNINEEKMLHALEGMTSDDYDLFQIDDGFETFVGDWLDIDESKFPNGLKPIVDKIHDKGLKAGLWLAPFVCETKSKVFNDHPDWLLLGEDGKPICMGMNWSNFYVLDLSKSDVCAYIAKCIKNYVDMGFDFFKLDFLYAAAYIGGSCDKGPGSMQHSMTHAEAVHRSMIEIRKIIGDKLILGCGVPLGSVWGVVDYCRIGTDISLDFDDKFYMRRAHRERVSTKTTIMNSIFRAAMDGFGFRCDPDVYLLRDDNMKLSIEQRRALTIINHLAGGLYLTSDYVSEYDDVKWAILKEARQYEDAKISDIKICGSIITISYILDGVEGELRYDSKKGVLL